jgi:predicted ester cyclase
MGIQNFLQSRPVNFRSLSARNCGRSAATTPKIRRIAAITASAFVLAAGAQPLQQQAGAPTSAIPSQSALRAEEKRNEVVIRRANESLSRRDLKAYIDCFAEDAKNFSVTMGAAGIRRGVEDILTTFPDWRSEILELVARGDSVITRLMVSGTHLGVGKLPMNGGMLVAVPPTGKHFSVEHIHWFKLRDGKIVAHTATRNDIGMMRQLGLLPATGLPK